MSEKDITRYAGMFVITMPNMAGTALCTDTDEIQFISDVLAEAGYAGMAFDCTHHRDIGGYVAAKNAVRRAQNEVCLENWLVVFQELKTGDGKA